MTQSLWDISADMQAFDSLLDEADFDSPAVQEALAKWSSEIQGNLEVKVDNYAAFIGVLNARAEARKAEAARLSTRAKTDSGNAEKLREHLKRVLEFHRIKSLDTARYKVTVARTGGKAPIEINVLPADLPTEFRKTKTEVSANTDAIRSALEAGTEVAGCRLLERGTYLKIS
jgi:hypothetical protein